MLVAVAGLLVPGTLPADKIDDSAVSSSPVHIIRLAGPVTQVMKDRLERQARDAVSEGADQIVLEMDTWGGDAIAALEMSDFIKNLEPRTTAWVNPKAISAGAMISLATDGIVMASRSYIGDCMPISGSGQAMGAAEREKIETKVREEFRDSARRNGYPLALCIGMVTRGPAVYEIQHNTNKEIRYVPTGELAAYGLSSSDAAAAPVQAPTEVPDEQTTENQADQLQEVAKRMFGVPATEQPKPAEEAPADIDSMPTTTKAYDPGQWTVQRRVLGEKQLLTISQTEALEMGFAKRLVSNKQELADYLNVDVSQFVVMEATWSENLVTFLTHPLMRGLLTIVMLMGLYSEMQAPGLGLPGGLAVVAFLTLVGAPYLAGLANAIEILIVLLGIILLAVEVFVIPGFGVAGITGLIMIFGGLLMTFVPEGGGFTPPDLPSTWAAMRSGFFTLLISMAIACVGFVFLTKYFGALPMVNRLILGEEQAAMTTSQGGEQTTTADIASVSIGDEGTVVATLRPSGTAQFECGVLAVMTAGELIESGSRVKVTEAVGNRIVVKEA